MELKKKPILLGVFLALFILFANRQNGFGQFEDPKSLVDIAFSPSLKKVKPGDFVEVTATLSIKKGWHINAHKPLEEFLIPTELKFNSSRKYTIAKISYPAPIFVKFAFSETKLAVYEQQAKIQIKIKLSEQLSSETIPVRGIVQYQACNENTCLSPVTKPFVFEMNVNSPGEKSPSLSTKNSSRPKLDMASGASTPIPQSTNEIGGLIAEKGLALSLIFIFLGGLALNLTPCVYPIIPITVSYFGGQASGRTMKMFVLALIYVLGMAVTYSLLGVIAALSGSLFGSMLQNPIVLIFVAAVLVGLALSMFGVWEITVPQSLNQFAGGARSGYLGALLMGLTVGIVAAPCIGPFVLALLTYVGATGNPMLGFWLFFVLSMGLGLPYLILGTFSASLRKLPQSGAWMVWVRKIFGFVLLGMAAYFLQPILPQMISRYILPVILAFGGLFIGFLDRIQFASKYFPLIKKSLGIAFIALAVWLSWPENKAVAGNWYPYSKQLVEEARTKKMPVIIDFTAEWCIACKELEKETFPSKPFLARANHFLLLRADLTQFASPPVEAIKKEYKIKGLPTVIFLDPDGVEQKELRVIGFISGEAFAKRMDLALANSS